MPLGQPPPGAKASHSRLPLAVQDSTASGRIVRGDETFRTVRSAMWDVSDRLREMDDAGVFAEVISPVPVALVYHEDRGDHTRYSRWLNDSIAAAVSTSDGRLIGLGSVPLPDIDSTRAELVRMSHELGLRGVEIGSRIGDLELDDKALRPFWETVEQLDLAVFIHPTEGGAGAIRRTGFLYDFGLGMLTETAMAATALVFGGVLADFPHLRVAFAHGCGTFSSAFPRLALAAQLTGGKPFEQLDHLVRRLYIDSLVFDQTMLPLLVERFGANRLLLGSDHPFIPGQPQRAFRDFSAAIAEGTLAPALELLVFEQNALEFLGLPPTGIDPSNGVDAQLVRSPTGAHRTEERTS